MGATSIEWADYTYNPWIGCEKVSPGCKNCYASVDTMARRYESAARRGRGLPLWGPGSTRHITTSTAAQVRAWNRNAAPFRAGYSDAGGEQYRRPRVFCASLGDVFEAPQHEPARSLIEQARPALWELIEECDELDWLLVTKRPENVLRMVPTHWLAASHMVREYGIARVQSAGGGWPPHVWLGTSVENQETADERIPELFAVQAAVGGRIPVLFLSMEPLLGPVDLKVVPCRACNHPGDILEWPCRRCKMRRFDWPDWVIVGGESGHGARPMHPDWARGIRDQCVAAGVPLFFKQWGEWFPADSDGRLRPRDNKLRLTVDCEEVAGMGFGRLGKKAAGRELDGRTWDELPKLDAASRG